MEFGKVTDPSNVKFTMPPDNAQTEALLSRLLPSGDGPVRMYVGGTNWGTKEWVGTLYPKGTKEKDFLSLYARQLNTIELNTLFYNLQPVSVIEKWANMTEPGFKFCPKFTQSISHELQLENAERDTDQFIARVHSLCAKLGSSLLQLSDRFGPDS